MVLTFSAKNKLGFVDGSIVAPNVTADEFMFWERCKNLVISWLLANLDYAITKRSNAEDASLSVKNSDNQPQDQYNHLLNLINQKNGRPSTTDHDDNGKHALLAETDNTITIPDGKKIRVFHIRTVKLNDDIILKDVLHVPDF
ncbi:hypothetical protein AgCh_033250 [Apium graveolens]